MRPRAKRLGLASVAGFAVLYLLFARTGIGRDVDQAALIDQLSSVEVDHVKLFDVGPVVVAIAVLGAIAWVRLGLVLAVAVAASIGVSSALALALTKVLPQVVAEDPSFPSGDATLGMAIACAMVLVATPSHRRAMVPSAAAVAIVVGVGLVALEWHRPAEVAAGYLVAVAYACSVLAIRGFAPSPRGADGGDAAGQSGRVGEGSGQSGRAGEGRGLVREALDVALSHPVATASAALASAFLVGLGARALVFAIEDGKLGDWFAFAVGEVLLAALAVVLLAALRSAVDEAAAPP